MNAYKKGLLFLYKSVNKKLHVLPKTIDKTLVIGDIKLCVNLLDDGSLPYLKSLEPANRLYELIQKDLKPGIILDIGANYGFISLVAHKYMPQARVIAVEPDPLLLSYLWKNLEGINSMVFSALCGEKEQEAFFSVNPTSSQDNRVYHEGWQQKKTHMVTIDSLVGDSPVFIKTDTQGYEKQVLDGGANRLKAKNWIIKMEYAPYLLREHCNPITFLRELVSQYDVVDLSLVPFKAESLNSLFKNRLKPYDVTDFVDYIESLPVGWLDILIRPRE